jgi:cytochrome P450
MLAMSQMTAEFAKPDNVPADLFVPGSIWGAWGGNPHEEFKQLLGGRNIVFLQEHYHAGHSSSGTWLVASAEANRQVLMNHEAFTSTGVKVFSRLLGNNLVFFPVEVDPPEHGKYRAILAPFFKPASATAMRDVLVQRVDEMLDVLIPKGGCEFVQEFAKTFPGSIFLDLVGLPRDRAPEFLGWAKTVTSASSAADKRAAMQRIGDYLMDEVKSRKETPRDDVLSHIVNGEIDGRPVTVEEATGCAVVLFLGGLDTVANQLGWTFRWLAEDQKMQDLLRAEPTRIARANEELLRYFSAVFLTRQATRDVDLAGVTIRAGDIVACALPMASRDGREFENPDVLDVDHSVRRYLSFGFGPHMCIGMYLAKLELNVVVERWLSRVPSFRVAPNYEATSSIASVISLDRLPLVWS